jgi:hypothetical protein
VGVFRRHMIIFGFLYFTLGGSVCAYYISYFDAIIGVLWALLWCEGAFCVCRGILHCRHGLCVMLRK